MPWSPKSAVPLCTDDTPSLIHPALDRAAAGGLTLFTAPAGFLPADALARTLRAHERPVIWLRLGREDRDPATLLISLIAAMRRLRAGAGAATLEQMRRRPGPVAGWPALFSSIAEELSEILSTGGALVVEQFHHLGDAYQTLRLLGGHVLADLPESVACILSAERTLHHDGLPAHAVYQDTADLRLGSHAAQMLLDQRKCELPAAAARNLVGLSGGRAVALATLCSAVEALGPAPIQQALSRTTTLDDLLAWVARAWLVTLPAGATHAIALALRLEYVHPVLLGVALDSDALPAGPWFEPLDDRWIYLRPIWRAPVRAALRRSSAPERQSIQRAAAELVSHGAIEQAVPLYFELGDWDAAARVIAGAADQLMSIGQWETLDEWLSQLPERTLDDWPWLVYISGELAAVQAQLAAAQRAFALAVRIFTARHDTAGSCQSLLAESTLAQWQGDHSRATTRALTASTLAENGGLPWYRSWAAWQLGCLASAADDLDTALVYFTRAEAAAVATGDALIPELPRQAERLTLYQRELRQQRELHRRAYFAAEQAEQQAVERLRMLVAAPAGGVDALLEAHGWVQLPLMLKLAPPSPASAANVVAVRPSRLDRLLGKFGLRRHSDDRAAAAQTAAPQPTPPRLQVIDQALDDVAPAQDLAEAREAAKLVIAPGSALSFQAERPASASAALGPELALEVGVSAPQPIPIAAPAPRTLAAHLLGPFRATLNDRPIESWPSARGRSILKYLLTQGDRAVPRDVLMDLFWPDTPSDAARNNLNVALHGLRQALRAADEQPVVVFENGAYRLSADLVVWVDVEEFERRCQTARQLEAAGQLTAAVAEYEVAVSLYQDDFFADDPYEEWPVLTRERLRVLFLEALDQLSQIYFARGQYAACAGFCQRILARDSCREDAHCRLMRCFSRQGQHNLALRQYQICAEALRAELDIEPAPATLELCNRTRRHEQV